MDFKYIACIKLCAYIIGLGRTFYIKNNMISLKRILLEVKLYSMSLEEVLDHLKMFEGKTLIFMDTEASGLEPNSEYEQVTQIGALAVNGSTWEVLGEFNEKIALTPGTLRLLNDPKSKETKMYNADHARWLRKYKRPYKHPRDTLHGTHYYDGQPMETRKDEKTTLLKFDEFINQWSDVILIAHNASFDMKMIGARRRMNGLPPTKKYKVFDSLKLARYAFIPMLVALESNEWAAEMLKKMLAKTKYKSYGADLGKLADVFKIETNWHDALEDVKATVSILRGIIDLISKNKDVNIRGYQGKQAKRFRRMKI